MVIRSIVALALVAGLAVGVVSASSLGTFEDVTLAAGTTSEAPCEVGSVEFRSGGQVVESLLELLDTEVDEISLQGLSGDCVGLRPIVVVYGDPNILDLSSEEVALSRTELTQLTDLTGAPLAVDPGDELNTLLDASDDPTQVRVALCPVGATCT